MTTVTDSQIAKVTRNFHSVLERVLKGSLDPDHLVLVLAHLIGKGVRAENLLAYAKENCPKIDWADPNVPKAKRMPKKSAPAVQVNPAEFFVSSSRFWVDDNLARNIDLSPVADDVRELRQLFPLPRKMNDTAIAKQAGGIQKLVAKQTTLPQLIRECKRALEGQPSLIQKGGYYLFYLEGKSGDLCPVRVGWFVGVLAVCCCRFDQGGRWDQGDVVCGN